MPAPTQATIKGNIRDALLGVIDPATSKPKFCKKEIVDGAVKYTETELMSGMEDLMDCLATGIQKTWADWQDDQIVSGTVTVAGASLTGPISNGKLP
jgi:capsid protein